MLSPHTAQLRDFFRVMGPALSSVSSIDVTITGHSTVAVGQYDKGMEETSLEDCSLECLNSAAGLELGSLLAAACPNICRLGTNGGLGDGAACLRRGMVQAVLP